MTGKAKEPSVGMVRLDQVIAHPHNVRRELGDLRSLATSIRRHGVMVPIIVERYGQQLRLRAGHRRVTAARLAGIVRVPAIIHHEALDEEEWLIASVQENYQRRDLDAQERRRTVQRLRELGLTWDGIAEAFGVKAVTVRTWTVDEAPDDPDDDKAAEAREKAERKQRARIAEKARTAACSQLAASYPAEYTRLYNIARAKLEAEAAGKSHRAVEIAS